MASAWNNYTTYYLSGTYYVPGTLHALFVNLTTALRSSIMIPIFQIRNRDSEKELVAESRLEPIPS